MISRRGFGAYAGAALFTACACGRAHAQRPTTAGGAPRRVAIGGGDVPVIDFHAHCVIPEVAQVIKGTPVEHALPKFQLIGDARSRLAAMDHRGVQKQLLTINDYWWYAADDALAADIVRVQDEGLAAVCRAHPDRFLAVSSPALQNPRAAADQLRFAVTKLGLKGGSIAGSVRGNAPTTPEFEPFWAAAEELDVPIFMHPVAAGSIARPDAWKGRGDLQTVIGNPLETTVFLTKMIYDGVLDRFPKLKLVGAHGGGYLPSYLPRTDIGCTYLSKAHCANKRAPHEYLKDQIMVDTLVFSAENLRHLLTASPASQVVYGTDLPFPWPDTLDDVLAQSLSDDDKRAILGGNAARILKLT
jgi:aminocarboxymuconate-semialdehyde decarboxylase